MLSVDDFLKPMDRIDWELYEYIACGWVASNYSDSKCAQNGECSREEFGIRYYSTVFPNDGKYYFLGDMPSFNPYVY